MIGITVISGFIAVRFNSVLVAVLGVIGGYGTPLMLASSVPNLPGPLWLHAAFGLGCTCDSRLIATVPLGQHSELLSELRFAWSGLEPLYA
jgi:hypothetical protein